ncbi:unnamed protein product [Urochloa humidicola]
MGEKLIFPMKSTTTSPEMAGGSSEYDVGELLHHLDHLFVAGDQGEGHPQASTSSSLSTSWMNLARSTPTPPYANKRSLSRTLLVAGEPPSPPTISLSPSINHASTSLALFTIDDLEHHTPNACQIYHFG